MLRGVECLQVIRCCSHPFPPGRNEHLRLAGKRVLRTLARQKGEGGLDGMGAGEGAVGWRLKDKTAGTRMVEAEKLKLNEVSLE